MDSNHWVKTKLKIHLCTGEIICEMTTLTAAFLSFQLLQWFGSKINWNMPLSGAMFHYIVTPNPFHLLYIIGDLKMDQQSAQVWFVKCRCSKKDFEREKIDKNHPICINLMVSNLRDFEFFEFRYILHRKITPQIYLALMQLSKMV